jgi:hypothetical protein
MNSTSNDRLSLAFKANGPTLIYDVDGLAQVLVVLNTAAGKTLIPVDARGEVSATALRTEISTRDRETGPLLVLLGTELSAGARTFLDELTVDSNGKGRKLIAVTPAAVPTAEMGALFTMQIAASRIVLERS